MKAKQEIFKKYEKLIPGLELADMDDPGMLFEHAEQHRREAEYYETYEPHDIAAIELHWQYYALFDSLAWQLQEMETKEA